MVKNSFMSKWFFLNNTFIDLRVTNLEDIWTFQSDRQIRTYSFAAPQEAAKKFNLAPFWARHFFKGNPP